MLPLAEELQGHAEFFFQENSAPTRIAKATKGQFIDYDVVWPTNYPHLNLMSTVKRQIRDTRPNYADELKEQLTL